MSNTTKCHIALALLNGLLEKGLLDHAEYHKAKLALEDRYDTVCA